MMEEIVMSQQRLGNGFGDQYGASLDFGGISCYTSIPFAIEKEERKILRELAHKVHDLASRPIEEEKKELWYAHNAAQSTRPLIFCDPENGWYEIIRSTDLKCHNKLARLWEFRLRKEIFWAEEMKDDRVIEDIFHVHYLFSYGDFGLPLDIHMPDDLNGAYNWEPPIKDYNEALKKLKIRDINIEYEKSFQLFNLAQEVLGDILHVKFKSAFWWSYGMTADYINLRGLENLMLDMYDHPDEVHATMALLRDDAMHQLDYFEEKNLLTLNNQGSYVGSGGFGWSRELPGEDFDGAVKCSDLWGHFESQETVGVSPEMFAEFIYPYQKPIMERFSLNCYGCCEPLNKRWDIIKDAPNLRRVSVSAWADIYEMADMLGGDYVYSWKPTPSMLAQSEIDQELIREYLRKTAVAAKDCRLEMIMKDNHTIGGNPQNVIDWVKIAREVTEEA